MPVVVPRDDLLRFYRECFTRSGVPIDSAAIVADSLLDADLSGSETHGIARLAVYAERLRTGGVVAHAVPEVVRDDGSTVLVDGGHALGQVVATRGMQLAIERAKDHGVAAVACHHSTHLGALGYYARMAVLDGQIGVATTGVAASIAPLGAAEPLLGSNPWSVAIPTRRHPTIVVDLANAALIRTAVRAAAHNDRTLPPGVAIDADGRPTQHARTALAGSVLAFGGHKGYALTLVLEVLTSVLTGAAYSYQIARFEDPGSPKGVGHFFVAIDVDRFLPIDEFCRRVDDLADHVKAARRGPTQSGVRLPGERSARMRADRERSGIPISQDLARSAREVGDSLGVDAPF